MPLALACLALWPAASHAFVGCTHSGGTLRVFATTSEDRLTIARGGDAINALAEGEYGGPSVLLACSGGAPTVNNTDRIAIEHGSGRDLGVVELDLGGGPFAPGATLEADGSSEIEIQVTAGGKAGLLGLSGSGGADHFDLGRTAAGLLGVNLNPLSESAPDVDLELTGREYLLVAGRAGADVVTSQGAPGFAGPYDAAFVSFGGRGADLLAGGSGVNLLYGGGQRDTLIGSGRKDIMVPGKGRDRVVTGPGPDIVYSIDGARDKVNCGSGRDQGILDARDKGASCARIAERDFKPKNIPRLVLELLIGSLEGGDD